MAHGITGRIAHHGEADFAAQTGSKALNAGAHGGGGQLRLCGPHGGPRRSIWLWASRSLVLISMLHTASDLLQKNKNAGWSKGWSKLQSSSATDPRYWILNAKRNLVFLAYTFEDMSEQIWTKLTWSTANLRKARAPQTNEGIKLLYDCRPLPKSERRLNGVDFLLGERFSSHFKQTRYMTPGNLLTKFTQNIFRKGHRDNKTCLWIPRNKSERIQEEGVVEWREETS